MDDLHDDLLNQILVRLPAKSIVRFKSVSKTWCSLLENPRFVSEHLNLNKKKRHLLIIQSKYKYLDRLCLLHDQTLVPYQDLFPPMPPSVRSPCLRVHIHDGLLCLVDCTCTDYGITLWNPATREFRLVPKICHGNIPPTEVRYQFTGFGSDSWSSEYKVIQCYFYHDSITKRAVEPSRHFVYCLSTNSWRELKGKHVEAAISFPNITRSNACVNGVHYWVGFKFEDGYNCILAFHFSTEVYEFIDVPISTRLAKGHLLRFPEDRISLWIQNSTDDFGDVWLLNNDVNYKGQYFWTKLLSIDQFPQLGRMLRFWNNEVFVHLRNGRRVLLCNLEAEKYQEVEIKIEKDWHLSGIYTYEESLFPIAYRN
ncbi:hypothetical protein COLO4_23510 [Corchorus olitorius]|uniref:F-box domain-containing protein n=1 Tax=Corchorus olitorius TaxID=93759 RepID=A0A1R3IG61_9ROSI|nr:hypothetical protein COLO4_23510 [Corchorus olitorius]